MSDFLNGIILHEGYNDLGTITTDINKVAQPLETEVGPRENINPHSGTLLFKFEFSPSGDALPSDYAVKFDLPQLNGIKEITDELLIEGGQHTFSFALDETPVRAATLSITDGRETFSDNGTGSLLGSAGGTGTINYETGVGKVNFFNAPALSGSIVANYETDIVVNDENLGSATGSATYTLQLDHGDILPNSVSILCDTLSLTDNGSGILTGTDGSGSINYETGLIRLTGVNTGITGDFLADYLYWNDAPEMEIGTGAVTNYFDFTIVHHPLIAGSLSISDGTEEFADNGDGTLSGSAGGTGTIDYNTGKGSVTFFAAPAYGVSIFAGYSTKNNIIETNPQAEGFIEIVAPLYPIVELNDAGEALINYEVVGKMDDREEELYLQLDNGMGTGGIYTLITDIHVKDGLLNIFDGDSTYYNVFPVIPVGADINAVWVNREGEIKGYDGVAQEWTSIGTLQFYSIEFPEKLTVVSDGFYQTNADIGTVTSGELGEASTVFEEFYGLVNNGEQYKINTSVSVFAPGSERALKIQDIPNLSPGNLNFEIIKITADPYVKPDETPTLDDIETVSGISLSSIFRNFLVEKGLTTIEKIRKAGPITYIQGYPEGVGAEELKVVQAHVDLYSMNAHTTQNQRMITQGYDTIFAIANAPKNVFLNVVVDVNLPLFRAAQIHETAVQNQKLVSNLLANVLSDSRMAAPGIPDVEGSTFRSSALAKAVNTCGCSDCQSNISPFAYLMDLIKYASAHVSHNPGYSPGMPNALNTFITLISDKFLQPFGTLNVDCNTLHDEYCRVRLVTEVLEKWVLLNPDPGPKQNTLDTERDNFLLLVYKSILVLSGTSISEVANMIALPNGSEKTAAAQKIADKMGVPLYVPSTTDFTGEAIWLTIGNAVPSHELTAINLEALFGFRDTNRNVITNTPVSYVELWRAAKLRDDWEANDYYFSNYSREGADPSNISTIKANWKPIVDPDFMGWEDMTYLQNTDAKDLWAHRKADTDRVLSKYVNNYKAETSIDLTTLVVKAEGEDLASQVIESNTIQLQNPTGAAWTALTIIGKSVKGTDTDLVLDRTLAPNPMWQPLGPNPTVKYNRVVDIPTQNTPLSGTSFSIFWTEEVIKNETTAEAKLISSGDSQQFKISNLTMTVTWVSETQVDIVLSSAPTNPTAFFGGNLQFIYEAEVPLVNDTIIDPTALCAYLFGTQESYTYLSPPVMAPTLYYPFTVTVAWPTEINASSFFGKLKQIQDKLAAAQMVETLTSLISANLRMTVATFNRMMQILRSCESYLSGMFSQTRPTTKDLYEAASIIRISGKKQILLSWVREEIEFPLSSSGNLALNGKYFWKSMLEPSSGTWDPSLQTVPAAVMDITDDSLPIIDPELLAVTDMLDLPETLPYRVLYEARQLQLDTLQTTFENYVIPYLATGFASVLNYTAVNNPNLPFSILPYASLDDLQSDLESNDPFKHKKAADVVWNTFRITSDDFIVVLNVRTRYLSTNANDTPTNNELRSIVKICVSGHKRKFLYPGTMYVTGWIAEEIIGGPVLTTDFPVYYYNVVKMHLAPQRGNTDDREEWQKTLALWNRMPIVQPDIVPLENVKNIINTNWAYNTWNGRKTSLTSDHVSLVTMLTQTTNSAVLDVLEDLINIVVGRVGNYGATPTEYLVYFTNIRVKEAAGEDIRPYLSQIGITLTEYRYLLKIYELFEGLPGAGTPPWLDSEIKDVADIFIAINSRNLTFAQIKEEYDNGLVLSSDEFQIYKAPLPNYPITNLPEPNAWRFNYKLLKDWENTLQGRIDSEASVKTQWKEVLKEAEDANMPLLRDALIRFLTPDCTNWQDTAEALARTFFIETKDNCCVKHTRVSFAIETLQGLIFALHNGIFDGFISNFSLSAPEFAAEWKWIGSYATWRSAMFVFIYPENLLYPSLKRSQSPAFIELSQTLQQATRFTPMNACEAAQRYEDYLSDILDLKIVCTTSVRNIYEQQGPHDCCGVPTVMKPETYIFAQTSKGVPYYAIKDTTQHDGLGYWQRLPVEGDQINILGGFTYGTRWDGWKDQPLALYVFFTYKENGVLKMGYVSKKIFEQSDWGKQKDCEDVPKNGQGLPNTNILACQQSMDWDHPCFVISSVWISSDYAHNVYLYDIAADKFVKQDCQVINKVVKPDIAIRHLYSLNWRPGITIFFPKTATTLATIHFGILWTQKTFKFSFGDVSPMIGAAVDFWVGAFDDRTVHPNQSLTVHYRHSDTLYFVWQIKVDSELLWNVLTANNNSFPLTLNHLATNVPANVRKIYPSFCERDAPLLYSINDNYQNDFAVKFSNSYTLGNYCALKPLPIANIQIESAECITDMGLRQLSITNMLKANMNQPQGTAAPGWVKRPETLKEVLFEAYYYVPMLIALDQHKRGQFETALLWYRSVYDYTADVLNKRKIFYGLTMEETISNSYTQAANWLLDPLNPHLIAQTRRNAYTKYTLMNIIQCLYAFGDREYTLDTIETVPNARKLYSAALDLLKTEELQIKSNECFSNANYCLPTLAPEVNAMPEWNNMMERVQNSMAEIGDPVMIDSVAEEIAAILNAVSSDTYAERFAAAFAVIESNTPPEPTALTVTQVVQNNVTEINNAYRYLFANEKQGAFVEHVNNNYAETLSGLTGISVEDLSSTASEPKLGWLTETPPLVQQPLEFSFSDPGGEQYFPTQLGFNPLVPTTTPFTVNIRYVNIPFIIGQYQVGMPVEYTPILGYNFCMPQNPVYSSLELKGHLELYKIFNCRNIAGMVRELDAYAAATDSVSGMPVIGASGNLITPAIGTYTPSQYRFRVLIERTKQIVAQAQQMESLFLAALEKEDAENYNQLRAKQDLETAKATVKLQDLRINQANNEKVIADLQLDKANFTKNHYQNLVDSGLNAYEITSLILLQTAVFFQTASIFQFIASAATSLASIDVAAGIAGSLSAIGQAQGAAAGAFTTQSSILAQLASFQRRQEEWSFQKDLANFDISISTQQVKVAVDNVRIVTQERQIAQLNTNHAEASLDFLKNKFTNAELYNFMGGVLERSYSYMLNLSTAIARTAEKQLYFERQEQAGPFILNDYWEMPSNGMGSGGSGQGVDRRGLTGSARLLVDVTRLDQYAFDTNKRKLQMTKVISLSRNFPMEFQQFRETGILPFSLTNQLFDYDFPGHYLRLISNVKTTVVGLVPVYDQVKATLTADTISYTVIGGTTFQKIPIRRLELDSVALTSANNATGIFEMQPMQNELLNPFEGMGVESRWEFKMPHFSNRMDYSNIADILLTVDYTAFDSYQYRYQVLQDIGNEITFNRGFSFKNHFPDQWYELAEVQDESDVFEVTIDLKREMYPAGINNLTLNSQEVTLYFVREDGFTNEIKDFALRAENVSSISPAPGMSTTGGKVTVASIGTDPVMKLKLIFDNVLDNRVLFTEGKIKDILLMVPCKADLKSYPL